MQKYNDYPIQECLDTVEPKVNAGLWRFYQKWTCRHCGSRQTMGEPNVFFRSGTCEECGKVSPIDKCNYMLITRPEDMP